MGRGIGERFQGRGIFGARVRISHDSVPADARSRQVCERIRIDPTRGGKKAGDQPASSERSSEGKNPEVQHRRPRENAVTDRGPCGCACERGMMGA